MIYVFFSMIQVAVNSVLVGQGHRQITVWLDRAARIIYPMIFLSIVFISLVGIIKIL